MPSTRSLCLFALLLLACPADEGEGATTTTDSAQTSEETSATETETGELDPVCYANGGIYGACSEALCFCVQGGDLYQYCSTSCTETSECGDASEFPGATPSCEPVNPGDPNMICVLRCDSDADCPCGLECESTYKLCSEPQ